MKIARISTSAVLLVVVFTAGCKSDGLTEVTGKVTLDGKAVKGLEVRFEPKDSSIGTTAIGYTQADGTYKLHYPGTRRCAPVGEYTVHISGGEGDVEGEAPPLKVASKYGEKSELTAKVEPGPNVINFEVTSE